MSWLYVPIVGVLLFVIAAIHTATERNPDAGRVLMAALANLMIATSVWVYFDAKAIGIKNLRDADVDLGPVGWAVWCFLFWLFFFPFYLFKRHRFRKQVLAAVERSMRLLMNNSRTGEMKSVKVGWSWTCFLFSGFFGIPLFLRGLVSLGLVAAAMGLIGGAIEMSSRIFVVAPFLAAENGPPDNAATLIGASMYFIVNSPFIALSVYWGNTGNKKYFLRLLERGWSPIDPDDPAFVYAQTKWSLAASPLVQRALAHKRCPFCSEAILADARKCKHCGEALGQIGSA